MRGKRSTDYFVDVQSACQFFGSQCSVVVLTKPKSPHFRYFGVHFKKSKSASIINIGSISGLQSERGTLSYATSKSALMHATKILAKELSIYNIRVNSVAPNIVKTDMLKKMDKKILKKMLTQTPHNKPLSVNDVSKIVMYLASEKSSKLNGKILKI